MALPKEIQDEFLGVLEQLDGRPDVSWTTGLRIRHLGYWVLTHAMSLDKSTPTEEEITRLSAELRGPFGEALFTYLYEPSTHKFLRAFKLAKQINQARLEQAYMEAVFPDPNDFREKYARWLDHEEVGLTVLPGWLRLCAHFRGLSAVYAQYVERRDKVRCNVDGS